MNTSDGIPSEISACAHFWAIESPRGPLSLGVCKRCGEQREFRNSLPLSRWDTEAEKPNLRLPQSIPPQP